MTEQKTEEPASKDNERLSGKKKIKEALNKDNGSKKAHTLRKKRMRNELRAEAYHSARGTTGIPLRVKIMVILIIVTGTMLVIHRSRYEKRNRVDNVWEAAKAGDYDAVMRVLNSRPEFVDMKDDKDNTLMHYAAMSGNVGICRAILELRGDYSRINMHKRLPIHYAAEYGSTEIAEILINRNTLISMRDEDGLQPIHLAARNGHAKIIDLFRESGQKSLKVNALATFRMTALHFAAQAGKLKAVEALLKFKDVDVNPLNSHGQTPLHFAVREGNLQVVKALIDAGANPNFASKGTRSALDFAKEIKNEAIIKMLSDASGPRGGGEVTP